jgi:hypothetical protein
VSLLGQSVETVAATPAARPWTRASDVERESSIANDHNGAIEIGNKPQNPEGLKKDRKHLSTRISEEEGSYPVCIDSVNDFFEKIAKTPFTPLSQRNRIWWKDSRLPRASSKGERERNRTVELLNSRSATMRCAAVSR